MNTPSVTESTEKAAYAQTLEQLAWLDVEMRLFVSVGSWSGKLPDMVRALEAANLDPNVPRADATRDKIFADVQVDFEVSSGSNAANFPHWLRANHAKSLKFIQLLSVR